MVVVLTAICGGSALLLSYANEATKAQREYQLLKYVKEPSIKAVLSGYDNDPIRDRFTLELGIDEKGHPSMKNVFPARQGEQLLAVAYGTSATGYHGPIEVMVGIDASGTLTGISIMTHTETPGLGARVVEEGFTGQFKGLSLSDELELSANGGEIDAISGATLSSKGVLKAVKKALELFPDVRKEAS
jgi:electron transport complex protein RnfG